MTTYRHSGIIGQTELKENTSAKDIPVDLDYAVNRVGDILPGDYELVIALKRGSMIAWLENKGDKVPAVMETSNETPSELVMRLLNQAVRKDAFEREQKRLARRRAKSQKQKVVK
jgi:hypothetical protein